MENTEIEDLESSDIDILLTLRSGKTSLKELQKLKQVIMTSITSLGLKAVLTEEELRFIHKPVGDLAAIKSSFHIE